MKQTMMELFGSKTFDKVKMKARLSADTYQRYKEAVRDLAPLDLATANEIAQAMVVWALEEGATHYTHWFQPMAGTTAKKHESFLERDEDYQPLINFRGQDLVKGESDASSFPSGGLRETFEARGYTYWDITSQIFIREHVMYVPTIFVSYHGEALDKKLPLLKAITAVNQQATRVMNLLGYQDIKSVTPVIGIEQEYFLVDYQLYKQRMDLVYAGKTLVGALGPKGQEMGDHYYGAIPSRVQAFMNDVNKELWKLGIFAKTEHNEAAPCQFELAPIYGSCNIAIDQNLQTMEVLQSVAIKHGLACLFNEKPFKGVNGSGKHNNFSYLTNTGKNVFKPGKQPQNNPVFLIFLCALLRGVDLYPELLRMSASGPGNDERLGSHEAPPAIISVFLGNYLEQLLNDIVADVDVVHQPREFKPLTNIKELPYDHADRNRTSPLAFTGNKFEFRMVGSSLTAATTNTVINTIMAKTLEEIAEVLTLRGNSMEVVYSIVKATMQRHGRIIFNGNGYAAQWLVDAQQRGLPNIPTHYQSLASLSMPNVLSLFERFGVLSATELNSRQQVHYQELCNVRIIEAKTLHTMLQEAIFPGYLKQLVEWKSILGVHHNDILQQNTNQLEQLIKQAMVYDRNLQQLLNQANEFEQPITKGDFIQRMVFPLVVALRSCVDQAEVLCAREHYRMVNYHDLFLSIK